MRTDDDDDDDEEEEEETAGTPLRVPFSNFPPLGGEPCPLQAAWGDP